jgi:hypothetical protein
MAAQKLWPELTHGLQGGRSIDALKLLRSDQMAHAPGRRL